MSQQYLRRELQEKIRSDPQLFEFLQSSSTDGMWYRDLEESGHQWTNAAFWHLLGIDPATRAHSLEEWEAVAHPEDLAQARVAIARHLEDPDQPCDQTMRFRHADGSTITVRCRVMAFFDARGTPLRLLGTQTDLTFLKRTEERLEAANHELAQQVLLARASVLAKDGFLSTMSHEVRTPLNAILGFFQLLQASDITQRQRAWTEKGLEAAETLLGTLNHVLDASRLEAELVTPKASSVCLGDVARQIEAVLEGRIAKSGKPLAFTVQVSPDLPDRISIDRLRLMQITNNLIDNAVKFTAEGQVSVAIVPDPDFSDSFRIVTRDTGIGVARVDQARIFRSFEQVNESVTRAYGGSGLGLSISRDLAHLMGGDLRVESDGQSGTSFILSLPIYAEGAEVAA